MIIIADCMTAIDGSMTISRNDNSKKKGPPD
jgi:hypothetical protein